MNAPFFAPLRSTCAALSRELRGLRHASAQGWWSRLGRGVVVVLGWQLLLSPAPAALRTWSGAGANALWTTVSNWTGLVVPTNGDSVTFPAFALRRTNTYNLDVSNLVLVTIASDYLLNDTGARTLPLSGGITHSANATSNSVLMPVSVNADLTMQVTPATATLFVEAIRLNSNDLVLNGAGHLFLGPITNGTGTVTKLGLSTWITSSSNNFKGPTRVLAGTNILRGADFTNSASFTVSNATLRGVGRLPQLIVRNSARVEVGEPVGRLTVFNGLVATNAATLHFDLNGTTPGTGYDQLIVNGSVNLTNVTLSIANGFTPAVGASFIIVSNDLSDAVFGSFNGLPEGAEFVVGPVRYRITYAGGSGNDIALTAVPQLRIWTGTTTTNAWSIAGNWQGSLPPREGDSMLFPDVAAAENLMTNDFPTDTLFTMLLISNDVFTVRGNDFLLDDGIFVRFNTAGVDLFPRVRLNANQTWTVAGNCFVRTRAPLELNSKVLSITTTNTSGGDVILAGGAAGPGGVRFGTGGDLGLAGTNTFSSGVIVSNGSKLSVTGLVVNSSVVMHFGALNVGGVLPGALLNCSLLHTGFDFNVSASGLISNTPLNVSTGSLVMNGTMLRSATIFNSSSGVLIGTGTLGVVTMNLGTLAPRTDGGIGLLRCSNLVLTAGARLDIDTGTGSATPGVDYDQLKVTGTVNLGGATLVLGTTLATNAGATLVIVDNDGADPILGTFAGLPEGFTFSVSGTVVHITYVGGDGNDVALVIESIIPRGIWTGLSSIGDFWGLATNWSGSQFPGVNDDVVFPVGGLQPTNRNDAARTFRSLNFAGSGYALQLFNFGNTVKVNTGLFATNATGTNTLALPVEFLSSSSVVSNSAGNTLVLSSVGTNVQQNDFSIQATPIFDHAGVINVSDVNGDDALIKRGPGLLTVNSGEQSANHVQAGTLRVATSSGLGIHFNGASFQRGSVGISNAAVVELGSANYPNLFTVAGTLSAIDTNVAISTGISLLGTNALLAAANDASFTLQSFVSAPADARVQCDVGDDATLTIVGNISTTNGFLMDGSGSVVFRGVKSYTGLTRVNGGSLFSEGLQAGNSVEVNDNGAFSGFGVVGPLSCNSGFIAPGSPTTNASLVATQGVNFSTLGALRVRLNGTAPTQRDELRVTGPVILAGARLVTTLNFNPPIGSAYQVIDNDAADAVIGTFAGLPQNGFHTNGQAVFQVSYTGGSGNDVVLTVARYNFNTVPRHWTGGSTNDLWTNAQNWSNNIAPVAGDPLIFPVTALRRTNQNNFATNTVFQSITLLGADYRLAGNPLGLVADLSAQQPSGTNTIALRLSVTGTNEARCVNAAATLVLEGPLETNDRLLVLGGAGRQLVTGAVRGGGSVLKRSTGVVEMRANANSYGGNTEVVDGVLRLASTGPGAAGGNLTVTNAGVLQLSDVTSVNEQFFLFSRTIVSNTSAGLTLDGRLAMGGSPVLDIATTQTVVLRSILDGFGNLTKEGPGTLLAEDLGTISPTNRFFGSVVANGGAVLVRRVTLTNTLTANAGATIGGTTTVGRIVINAGTLAPGFPTNTPGALSARGVTLSANATYAVQLNGVQAGLQFDQVKVQGAVALGGATLRATVGFNAVIGTPFQIIDNDGSDAVVGTFAGLPEGTVFAVSNLFLSITYQGGDGNDVVLARAPPTTILNPVFNLGDGTKRITGIGLPGGLYLFEATTNLAPPVAWSFLGSDFADGAGLFEFIDVDATNFLFRFYRAQSPP